MVTETIPTREELQTEANRRAMEVKDADKAHAKALKTFESSVGQVPMEELLDLGRVVDKAKADADNAAKLAKRSQERADNFELEAKRDERNSLVQSLTSWIENAEELFSPMREVGVEKIVVTIDCNEESVSAKPTGPGIRSTTPRARSENGAGGFTSRGKVRVDGAEFSSLNRAYMELRAAADGVDPAQITPANSKSAQGWLEKTGHSVEFVS